MISKISTKGDLTVIWICHGSNTYGRHPLPLMCDGRVELQPHLTPLDLDDVNRLSQKRATPDKGFAFERQDLDMLKRIVDQLDYLDAMSKEAFDHFLAVATLPTLQSLPEVLASLDCDPEQKSPFAIKLADDSTLPETVSPKHKGFAVTILGDGFSVQVLLNNRYVWSSYDTAKLTKQYNPLWLFEKPDVGDPSVRPRKPPVLCRKPKADKPGD
jgi:hypothetical protein